MIGKVRFVGALGALCFTTFTAYAADPKAEAPKGAAKAGAAKPDAAKPDPKVDAAKADAAQRFDRGLKLFDEGDNAGALAEFKQVYSTMPNAVVLYNIGLVYAAMQRPVDAVDALQQVVGQSALSAEQQKRATATLEDQRARIGRLSITTVPAGAHISIDNVDVATTPLSEPIRVGAGSHVVGAIAEGYAQARKEVVVAGNAEASVSFQLLKAEATRDAALTVRSHIPGVEVFVNDKSAGKTPLATSLAVPPGHVKLELRRPGYVSAKQELDLEEGATSDVTLDPSIDAPALETEGVLLALDIGRKDADLFVDQNHFGAYRGPVRLPKGPHRVRVEAAGFMPLERDVMLESGKNNVIADKLEPTPETRAAHDASVRTHRLWGIISIGAGALIAGGGGVWLGVNSSKKSDAKTEYDAAKAAYNNRTSPCDFANGDRRDVCQALLDDTEASYTRTKNRDAFGYVGLGVGGAAIITGVVVLLTGPGKDEYAASAPEKLMRPRFAFTGGPGNFGAVLSGGF